jgi:addiction module RelE/StbE family toxin
MRLRYTRPALADLDSILEYITKHSPQGAARVHARIQTIVNLLLSHPHIGIQTDDPTIRRINTSPYPYLIFYEVAGDEIIVHALRHGARNHSALPGAES